MKKKTIGLLSGLGLSAAAVGSLATPAHAQDLTCTGSVGAITIDSVIVPELATCTLTGTRVTGSIKVEVGGTLRASGITLNGNVEGDTYRTVVVMASRVGGSVQLQQGGNANLRGNTVSGDIQLYTSTGLQTVARNNVSGSVEVKENTGGATVNANRIAGNLNCEDNLPAPTGSGNIVNGNKENQCATF